MIDKLSKPSERLLGISSTTFSSSEGGYLSLLVQSFSYKITLSISKFEAGNLFKFTAFSALFKDVKFCSGN